MTSKSSVNVSGYVTRIAPNIDDEAVIDYLVAAAQEATSEEEVRECFAPWVGEGEGSKQAVDQLCVALGLVADKQASSSTQRPSSAPARMRADAKATPSRRPAALGVEEQEGEEEGEEEAQSPDASSSSKKPLRKKEAKAQAKKAAKPLVASSLPPEELVEVRARVSRFHREAVQDEVTSAVAEVDIHGICISVAGCELLVDAHLKLCPGQRYGFVGRNGSGKSTLLRAMADRKIPGYPPNCVTLLVAQEDVGDERTAVDTVLSAHSELVELLQEESTILPVESGDAVQAARALRNLELFRAREALRKAAAYESKLSGLRGKAAREALLEAEHREREAKIAAEDPKCDPASTEEQAYAVEQLADVRERLRILGADSMRAKAEVLLKGLGFSKEQLSKPTHLLSGGWRMRCALAKALLAQPNVLLLDEPTNHLDWGAILWLERYLRSPEMEEVALVVVSHDRAFLDNVCTMILRLWEKQLQLHDGNYSTFEHAHAEDQQHRAELAQRTQDKKEKVMKQVQEMESRGRKTQNDSLLKAVASRRTKLGLDGKPWSFDRVGLERANGHKFKFSYATHFEALGEMATEAKEAEVKLRLKSAVALGFEAALLQARDVVVGYEAGKPLIRKFDLDIRSKARIALLGINGSGKTTLLRTLAKELQPLSGEVYQQPRAVVGFFCQHQADGLPMEVSAVEAFKERNSSCSEAEIRSHLGSFGIGRLAVQPIGTLSGGERCRVALASATFRPPHVLLLDEPTNHLDLPTVEALGKALQDFDGAVVITSHDRRLLREVCTDFYAVQGGKLVKLSNLEAFVSSVKS